MSKRFIKTFYHGVVFHGFHDEKVHKKSQGTLSKDNLYQIVKIIGRSNILDAKEFYERLLIGELNENCVCFTFDDGHKSIIDVALPVLEDLKIKSFFYIYSSALQGKIDKLELYRNFRNNYFNNVNEFYNLFYQYLNKDLTDFFKTKKNIILEKKKRYPFYSAEDIKFRVVRSDFFSESKDFDKIMFDLMALKGFDINKNCSKLFLSSDDIVYLERLGHKIGLHSHSHPVKIEKMSYEAQLNEYALNKSILSKTIQKPLDYIKTASHPCGSYNNNSLKVLNKLGIKLAFKDSMLVEKEKKMKKINNSNLEIARVDPFDIIKRN